MVYKWFYKLVRRRTMPIPEDTAYKWKQRLSIMYGLLAWNAFGLVVYAAFTGKADWAHYYGLKTDEEKEMAPGLAWSRSLNIPNAKVITISGFRKVDEYDIVNGVEKRTNKVVEQSERVDKELLNE